MNCVSLTFQQTSKSVGRALVLAQNNPALAIYKLSLLLTHSRLEHWRQNYKAARIIIKRRSGSFIFPSRSNKNTTNVVLCTPSWLVYSTHLTDISHALSVAPPDMQHALIVLQELTRIAELCQVTSVVLLPHVLRLRMLVDAGAWKSIGDALVTAEFALGFKYESEHSSSQEGPLAKQADLKELETEQTFVDFMAPFEAAMATRVLMMSAFYYTHVGNASSLVLSNLHPLLINSDQSNYFLLA